MFEQSFIYVIFDDGTDLYWARQPCPRIPQLRQRPPPRRRSTQTGPRRHRRRLGLPYCQYVLYPGYYAPDHPNGIWHDESNDKWYADPAQAPPDRRTALVKVRAFEKPGASPLDGKPLLSSNQDLASLRSLQDWYLRYQLTAVPNVSEVASIGGFVREYQVVLKPERLLAYNLPVATIMTAIQRSNNDVGGSVVEMSENEYVVRSRAYLQGLKYLA